MKKGLRIVLFAVLACVLVAALLFLLQSSKNRMHTVTCAGVKIEFADDFRFLNEAEIEGYLKDEYGNYIGQSIDSVNLLKIENILNSKRSVMKTDAYTTPDGYLNIRIHQRKPVVRFITDSSSFYADERGYIFPVNKSYTASVPIVDGNIPVSLNNDLKSELKDADKEWIKKIISFVNYAYASKDWSTRIGQISINKQGDIVLVPRKGNELFIFGQPDHVAQKFAKIEKYYTTVLPAKGAGYYKTVNVKYGDQIVCRQDK